MWELLSFWRHTWWNVPRNFICYDISVIALSAISDISQGTLVHGWIFVLE